MTPTTTRNNSGQRAAATRRANARRRSAAAKRAAATRELRQRTPVQRAQDLAERSVLVPVGAALVARDRVIETVTETVKPYRTRESAQRRIERDLRRFERRGTTARNRAERRLKRTRGRFEREARSLRQDIRRQTRVAQTRVDEAVTAGQKAVADVQGRVADNVS